MKRIKNLISVFVVISENGFEGSYESFGKAEAAAREIIEIDYKYELKILEVTKAWLLEIPEEPQPQLESLDLSDL